MNEENEALVRKVVETTMETERQMGRKQLLYNTRTLMEPVSYTHLESDRGADARLRDLRGHIRDLERNRRGLCGHRYYGHLRRRSNGNDRSRRRGLELSLIHI